LSLVPFAYLFLEFVAVQATASKSSIRCIEAKLLRSGPLAYSHSASVGRRYPWALALYLTKRQFELN
jgi:hypothetical protein